MLISLLHTLVLSFILVYSFSAGKSKLPIMDHLNHQTKNDKQDPEQQNDEPIGVGFEKELRNIQLEEEQQNPNDVVENVARNSKQRIGVIIRRIFDERFQNIWFLLQQLRELRHQPEVEQQKRLRDCLHQRVQQIVDQTIENHFPEVPQLGPKLLERLKVNDDDEQMEEVNNQGSRFYMINFLCHLKKQLQQQVQQEKVGVQLEHQQEFVAIRFLWKRQCVVCFEYQKARTEMVRVGNDYFCEKCADKLF